MKKPIFTAIAAVLMFTQTGIAQDELIIVDRGSRRETEKKPLRLNENTSVVKFSPTQMFVGEINFSYERQTSKYSSFEVSLGPTISNIALGNVQSHIIDPWGYSYRTSRMGAFGEVAYRYYPLDQTEALQAFYISPLLKVKMMNFGIVDGTGLLPDTKGSDLRASFALNVGYQWWMSKSFCMDFYAGMGIGYQQLKDSYVSTEFIDPNWVSVWKPSNSTGARYVFNFGFKVGIGQESKR